MTVAAPVTANHREAVVRLRTQMLVLNEILKGRPYQVPIHNALGQECVPVSLRSILRSGDHLYVTHRNVAHNLVWSSGLQEVLAFYEGSHEDTRLHMGGMNLTLPGSPIRYASSILGNNLPVAVGGALSLRQRGSDAVSCVVTGDGAVEEGAFYESLVFAASHDLPLVVALENNDHSMTSRIRDRRNEIDIVGLAGSIGVTGRTADGSSIDEVDEILRSAVAEAREGQPVMVEITVPIYNQHAGPTPGFPGDPMVVEVSAGLVLGPTGEDPVASIRDELGIEFEVLAEALLKEVGNGW